MFFFKLTNVPTDRKITYGKIFCDYKPHKKEKERVRLTVGGDMRYHWLTDRVRQQQFDVYWRPGREHIGDYHTNIIPRNIKKI
jgi:hypothetical protein